MLLRLTRIILSGSKRSCPMTTPLRALASLIVGITTVVGMMMYRRYSVEPPTDLFTSAMTVAAIIVAWLVIGFE
jgi:hypothetical protein